MIHFPIMSFPRMKNCAAVMSQLFTHAGGNKSRPHHNEVEKSAESLPVHYFS